MLPSSCCPWVCESLQDQFFSQLYIFYFSALFPHVTCFSRLLLKPAEQELTVETNSLYFLCSFSFLVRNDHRWLKVLVKFEETGRAQGKEKVMAPGSLFTDPSRLGRGPPGAALHVSQCTLFPSARQLLLTRKCGRYQIKIPLKSGIWFWQNASVLASLAPTPLQKQQQIITRAGKSLINILRCTFWDKMKEFKTACCVKCVFSWYILAFFPLYFWQDAYLNSYWNMKVKVDNPYGISFETKSITGYPSVNAHYLLSI